MVSRAGSERRTDRKARRALAQHAARHDQTVILAGSGCSSLLRCLSELWRYQHRSQFDQQDIPPRRARRKGKSSRNSMALPVRFSDLHFPRTTILKVCAACANFLAQEGGQSPFRKGDCPLSVAALPRWELRGEENNFGRARKYF